MKREVSWLVRMLAAACILAGWAGAGRAWAQGIQVVAGTYGGNCGQPHGNKTAHLASVCKGQADCKYKVDYSVIGDPAGGCQKDYVAEWRCGRWPEVLRTVVAPEAGFGSVAHLACERPREEHASGAIRVISATYGGNCRVPRGNATNALGRACNDHGDCVFKIDYTVLGDPAVGCQKDFQTEWVCGENPQVFRAGTAPEAGFGSTVRLHCEAGGFRPGTEEGIGGRPPRGVIRIVAGTYGSNCGQPRGNKTSHLASVCNGRAECKYKVDYSVIGDPAGGCQKSYEAEWVCGDDAGVLHASAPPEAGYGSLVTLSCQH